MSFLELRNTIRSNICFYGFLNISSLKNSLNNLYEIKNLEFLAAGVSTFVYKKTKDTVICISIDIAKVSYLQKAFKNKGFKFIRFFEFEVNEEVQYGMIYEMPLLEKISYGSEQDDLFLDYCCENNFEDQPVGVFNIDCQKFVEDLGVNNLDYKLLTKVMRRYNAQSDLHAEQFMKISSGEIVCIDPIISSYISF